MSRKICCRCHLRGTFDSASRKHLALVSSALVLEFTGRKLSVRPNEPTCRTPVNCNAYTGCPPALRGRTRHTTPQESAQFSAMATELSDQDTVGTALTLQMALGFTVTVVGIFAIPLVEVS